jgi:hypothetical protein
MNKSFLKIIFLLSIGACNDKPAPIPTSIPQSQTALKKDTVTPTNLLRAEHGVQQRYWETAAQTIKPKVSEFDTKSLKSAFYRHMKGQFNGKTSTLHLHFGHFQGDGDWAFTGNLYVDSLKKAYEIWGYLDNNRIYLSGHDKSQALRTAVWTGFAAFDAQQHLKGVFFQNQDLQEGTFDFQEVPVANSGIALTFEECYAKRMCDKRYQAKDDESHYSVIWMHHAWRAANPKDDFLDEHLHKTSDCAKDTQSFLKTALFKMEKAMKAALKNPDESIRNDAYFELQRATIDWNQDDLLVMRHYDCAQTAIYSYGGQDVKFATYDLKQKRVLTQKEVFKPDYDEDAFARAIYKHLDWSIDKDDLDQDGDLSLGEHEISDGFTSKGFYLIGTGNHGYHLSDKFVAYEAVEPFLRDDFKRTYWKR